MYPAISSIRTSTICAKDDRYADQHHPCNPAHRRHPPGALAHLLQDTTIEALLAQPDLDYYKVSLICRALLEGFFPYEKKHNDAKHFLIRWLVQHKQGKVLSHWLELTPLTLQVSTKEIAAGLLAIMQSASSFSSLTLQLVENRETDIAKEIIPLLGQAIKANQSVTKISLFLSEDDADELPPLFDTLAGISGLELVIEAGATAPTGFECLSKLLSRNKTLRVFELSMPESGPGDGDDQGPAARSAADAIRQLAGQWQLERLSLNAVPPGCQAVVGELMCTNHVLEELKIGLVGTTADPALINGFIQTGSVENVQLSMLGLEDGMLALVSVIGTGNTSIKSLEIRSRHSQIGGNDSSNICQLIAHSSTLASLIWHLPGGSNVDLRQIGKALVKNTRLETLKLIGPGEEKNDDRPCWVNETSISALAFNLQKNYTLTELVLASECEMASPIKYNYSVLQRVLDRNNAIQHYACSGGFLCGATEGFFATVGLPIDTVIGTARALMRYKPTTGVAALALVNKACYAQALFRRQQGHAMMLTNLLPLSQDLVVNNRQEMIGLLYRVIVSNGGFSTEDLARIAESETLPGALVAIMFRSSHDFLYLVKVFCKAVGMPVIRSGLISEIAKDDLVEACDLAGTGKAFILSMLEQSFPPDQKHLAPFVDKEINFDSISSVAAKLFIGYNIANVAELESSKAELVTWCVENRQPGVLVAYYAASPHEVSIDFQRFSGAFARSMMERFSQVKKLRSLYLNGIPEYEDALILQRLLSSTSSLKELHIDGNHCGQEFELLMQGLSLNTSITALSLEPRPIVAPPEICDALASLLTMNSKIQWILLRVHSDDPERPQLMQLAAVDDRLEVIQVERMEDLGQPPQ